MTKKDILKIHNSILEHFKNEWNKIYEIEHKMGILETLKNTINNQRLLTNITKELSILKQYYNQIKNNQNLLYYQLQVTPLIEKYKQELNRPIVMNFMGKPVKPDTVLRDEIEEQILVIIRNYGFDSFQNENETIVKEVENNYCEKCQNTTNDIIHKNIILCSICGVEKNVYFSSFSYKDIDRINITTRYTYDRRIHFRDCINQFQGKQNSSIPNKVYEDLENLILLHNLVSKNDKAPKIKRYAKVTKKHLFMFLKECGYSKRYEDINLIYHNITDKPLPDISHLEEQLMKDFDILSELYDKEYIQTQKITRKNFLNTHYVLYQLLQRHKFPCNKDDFNFLKTTERKQFHDNVCSHLFNILGWNMSNLF
jgi:hypothetical protein